MPKILVHVSSSYGRVASQQFSDAVYKLCVNCLPQVAKKLVYDLQFVY